MSVTLPGKGQGGKEPGLAENWDGAVGLFGELPQILTFGGGVRCVRVFSILGITEDAARVFITLLLFGLFKELLFCYFLRF